MELDKTKECDHWWKAMGVVSSAYFLNKSKEYIMYEISECKQCCETKIEVSNND